MIPTGNEGQVPSAADEALSRRLGARLTPTRIQLPFPLPGEAFLDSSTPLPPIDMLWSLKIGGILKFFECSDFFCCR
jgi:hypothetical protein